MIWDHSIEKESGRTDLVSHIAAEIDSACGDEILGGPLNSEELARAVEAYVAEESGGTYVDSGYLIMLASRALSSIGEKNAARRLLLLGTDMVSPSESEVAGSDAMWVLDLNKMTVRSDISLELAFFRSLNIVIESISDVWSPTQGVGFLGLRHVSSTALELLGGTGEKKHLSEFSVEILSRCQQKLDDVSRGQNWKHTPQVMNLDIVKS